MPYQPTKRGMVLGVAVALLAALAVLLIVYEVSRPANPPTRAMAI